MANSMGRKTLKVPKTIKKIPQTTESAADRKEIAYAVADGNEAKYYQKKGEVENHPNLEKDLKVKIDSSELMVITKTKKLTSYIITVTEKSPKRFRVVFVNRMQNLCLDCMELLIEANSIRMDSNQNKSLRRECQRKAYLKFKMLNYIAYTAYESGCILVNQLKEISLLSSEAISLLVAWRKSDAIKQQ